MAIIRTAKGLQEVQDTTLRDRLNQLNAPQVTSAAAAQSIGATPKQQDMAGTQVRKNAVIKENLAPKQEQLPLSDRYSQQQAALSGQQQAQLTEAQKLAKLAGLDTRVQKLAENRINQAATQPVQRQANESELSKTIPATDPRYAQASQALVDYANDPAKQEQALVTLQNLGITPARINDLLETTDAALGRAADVTQLKGSDLDADIRDMGYAGGILELSQQLGKDVGSLSVEDLTKEIQAYRSKVTGEKEKLEAQALNQTGMQQQAAMGQLGTFTRAGGVGQEQQVEQALQPIDMASTVKVGDQDMRVDELLQDQEFSDLIEQWAISSPEEREKLIPSAQFGPLVQWMTQNEASIKQADTAGQQAQTAFSATQEGVKALGKDVLQDKATLAKLVPGYDPAKSYTAAELADMDTKLKASSVYQFAKNSAEGRAYVNSFKPDEIDQIARMGEDELKRQATAYNTVKASPGIQKRYGFDPNKKVYKTSELQTIENHNKLVKDYPHLEILTNDEDFNGLTIPQLEYFNKNGQLNGPMVKEFKEFLAEQKAAASDNDSDVVKDVFGGTAEVLNARYADLKSRADYGDPDAIAALKDFATMDVSGGPNGEPDGKIDATDARKLAAGRKAELSGKTVDDFKTIYGTGAKGFQTLSEKNNELGTKVASATGSGIYADPLLQASMKSGDFSAYTKDFWNDPKAYNNLRELKKAYDSSGMEKTSKYQAIGRAMRDMASKYLANNLADVDIKLKSKTPEAVRQVMTDLELLRKSNDPRAKASVNSIESRLRGYSRERIAAELPQVASKTLYVSKGQDKNPLYDQFIDLAIGGSNVSSFITKAELNTFRDYVTSKINKDPTYMPNFADPNSKETKEMAAYMNSKGYKLRNVGGQ